MKALTSVSVTVWCKTMPSSVPVSVDARRGGNRQCQQRHSVHMVGDGLRGLHAALYPPRPLLGLKEKKQKNNGPKPVGVPSGDSWNLHKYVVFLHQRFCGSLL